MTINGFSIYRFHSRELRFSIYIAINYHQKEYKDISEYFLMDKNAKRREYYKLNSARINELQRKRRNEKSASRKAEAREATASPFDPTLQSGEDDGCETEEIEMLWQQLILKQQKELYDKGEPNLYVQVSKIYLQNWGHM